MFLAAMGFLNQDEKTHSWAPSTLLTVDNLDLLSSTDSFFKPSHDLASQSTCADEHQSSSEERQSSSEEAADAKHFGNDQIALMAGQLLKKFNKLAEKELKSRRPNGKISKSQKVQANAWPAARSVGSVSFASDNNIIFFDWDDTLLPSWYLVDVVQHECSEQELHTSGVSQHSPFYKPLEEHAQRIHHTLRAARKVGRVAIVTLSARPWLRTSAEKYLPNLDLDTLLNELEIPVYYAREYLPQYVARSQEDGVDMLVVGKRNAMIEFVQSFSATRNLISIGDSDIEKQAIKEASWCGSVGSWCKVVKLACKPSLAELSKQMQLISSLFGAMVEYEGDLDVNLESDHGVNDMISKLQRL